MDRIAFVFSGQGAQYSGMGRELAQCSVASGNLFKMADSVRPGTSAQCFEGTREELQNTKNTQPCIFCVDLAAALALREAGIEPHYLAGYSLGEVPALAFGGWLSYEEAFRYVIKRGFYMQECGDENPGAMYAVIGLTEAQVTELCRGQDGCYPVNYNGETQITVACAKSASEAFVEKAAAYGGKTVKLAVSGGFHSPMMDEARNKLEAEFKDSPFYTGSIPVYSNITAEPYNEKEQMFLQLNSPVLWYQTVCNLIAEGVDTFIEVGPGNTLSNMIRKISRNVRTLNVEDEKSLHNTLEVMKRAER